MVKPDKTKVKEYENQIRSKLNKLQSEEEKSAYNEYCIAECRKWDLDVNYHKAVENVFDYKYFKVENVPEDVPF